MVQMVDYKSIRKKLDERLKENLSEMPSDAQFDFWSVGLGWTDRCLNKKMIADPTGDKIKYEIFKKIIKQRFKILDAGCGDGMQLEWLAKNFPDLELELFGFDLSRIVLSRAKDRLKFYPSVTLTNNPIEYIPYPDDCFDVIMCFSVLQYAQDPFKALTEMERVLKCGGYLIIYKPRTNYYDPFLVPNIIYAIYGKIKEKQNKENTVERDIFSPRSGKEVEEYLCSFLENNSNLKLIKRKPFLARFNLGFYKRIAPWSMPVLLNFSRILNKLPFNYYRAGEFVIFIKRGES